MKTSKRLISLGTVTAIGFSLLSIVPASAVITSVLTMTNPVITVGVGSIATSTFGVTTAAPANTNTITYSFALTTNPGTNLTTFGATSDNVAVASGKAKLLFGGSETVTGYTNSAGTDTIIDTFATGGAAITTNSIRGSISAKPTAVGQYVLTVTATSTGATTSTATLTINAVALNTGSFTISKNSASSGVVKCAQTLTSNASTTITAGGGVCLSDALTPAGTGVWASGVSGFFGTILTNTTAGGGTGATLTAASPAQDDIAPAAFYTGDIASTTVASGIVASTISGMTVAAGANGLLLLNIDGALGNASAAGRITIGGTLISSATPTVRTGDGKMVVPFTAPVTAGTYIASVQVSVGGSYTGTGADTFTQAFTLTVSTNPSTSYGSTTVTKASGTADAAGVVYGAASYSGTAVATFTVSQKDQLGQALANADTKAMTVAISGVGSLATVASGATPSSVYQGYAAASNNSQTISVFGDARAGTATVTVAVNGATVATKTVVLYGAVAKITPTLNYAIGRAGGYESGALTKTGTTNTAVTSGTNDGLQSAGSLTQTAIAVALTDSAGNVVPVLPTVTSSNAAVVIGGIKTSFIDDGISDYSAGYGVIHMTYATAATSKSGDTATLTLSYQNAGGLLISATPLTIKIGGAIVTETIAFDKASYASGDPMTITRTAKDSAGNPVFDGAAAPAITFSKAVGGTVPGVSVYVGGTKSSTSSKGVQSVFAPTSSGAFSMSATSGNAAGSALTASSSVTDANAGLLTQIDALNAKIVALNALIAKIMKKLGVK